MLSDDVTSASIQVGKEAVSVSIRCAELTAKVLNDLVQSILSGKNKSSIIHGEQNIKDLNRQNKELLSVPITDKDIQNFREQLKEYGLDFSVRQDPKSDNYFVYFKGQDVAQIKDVLQSTVQDLLPQESREQENRQQIEQNEQGTEEKQQKDEKIIDEGREKQEIEKSAEEDPQKGEKITDKNKDKIKDGDLRSKPIKEKMKKATEKSADLAKGVAEQIKKPLTQKVGGRGE